MYSVDKINQNFSFLDYWDLQVEFRINKQLLNFKINNMDQVFMGEHISLKRAIDQKKTIQCFIDLGEEIGNDFLLIGTVSFTWKPERNECYLGNLWIKPEFRGNGLATYILNEIINFADELGIVLTLHALPFISPEKKPTNEEILKLKDYYQQFGFYENLETDGIGFNCSMKRFPRIWDY